MSEPQVVGIPVGGKAAPAAATLQPSTEPNRSAPTSAAAPIAKTQGGSSEPAAPVVHPTAEVGRGATGSGAPIFHLIAEPDRSAPAPAVESHLEVGVVGRPRLTDAEPTGGPTAEPPAASSRVRQPGRGLAVAAVAAVAIGSGFLIRALTLADPAPPPVPPAWAARAVAAVGHRAAPMGYSRPTRVSIARVGIHADVLALGVGRDGAVGVPPAGEPLTAAWYDRGPAPGQAGPAVITGHVDSRFAPGHRAAFYELGAVRPGDEVDVARADRRVAVFRVGSVALVPKDGFPTREVYGPTGYPALRLITCGGHYDRRTGYADNVIVYAYLVGSR